MDLAGADRDEVLGQLRRRFGESCVDFTVEDDAFMEAVATAEEGLLEQYLERGTLAQPDIAAAVGRGTVTPCSFGAALQLAGVDRFLEVLARYAPLPRPGKAFGAKVFKIARDSQNNRLTYLKVTGGCLRVNNSAQRPRRCLAGR